MKVSIITPSFNQAQFLEQTIDSVLSQRYSSLEYIIIDGGSTDGSVDIIKRYEKYLAYWESKPDRGQSHAINKGALRVTGEVINWLNSDDYLQPDCLKTVVEYFRHPGVAVVAGKGNIVQDGSVIRTSRGTDVYDDNLAKTIGWARIDQPETFFRTTFFKELLPLNEALHYVMDKELWIRYLLRHGIEHVLKVDKVLINFRLHDASKTQSQSSAFSTDTNTIFYQLALQNQLPAEAWFISSFLDIKPVRLEGVRHSDRELVRKAINYFLLYKADELYYRGKYGKARTMIDKIDVNCLDRNDLSLVKKLKFRTGIPKWLLQILRGWK